MIWNKKILFLHCPKTAGMSMSNLLTNHLEGQVSMTIDTNKQYRKGNVFYIPGKRHETLIDAASFFNYRNIRLDQFERIFVVMRNPYDLELSRYHYLRNNFPSDRGIAQDIALNNDFRYYLQTAPFFGMNPPRLDLYFHLNGIILENLIILRFERLLFDIRLYLDNYLNDSYSLIHKNQSEHKDFNEVYDEDMELMCYNRHSWFFDKSFYQRLKK